MSEAPAPEPDAAVAVPDTGGQGAANLEPDPPDPVTIVPPARADPHPTQPPPPDPDSPTPPASAEIEMGEDVVLDVTDEELAEAESDNPTNGVDPDEVAEGLKQSSRPTANGTDDPPALSRPIPMIGNAEFDAARQKPLTERPEPSNSASGSLGMIQVQLDLERKFGLVFPDPDNQPMKLVSNFKKMLLQGHWPEDADAQEVMAALLPVLNSSKFPQGGSWAAYDFAKLRSTFLTEIARHTRLNELAKTLRTEAARKQTEQRKRVRNT